MQNYYYEIVYKCVRMRKNVYKENKALRVWKKIISQFFFSFVEFGTTLNTEATWRVEFSPSSQFVFKTPNYKDIELYHRNSRVTEEISFMKIDLN
jgi:hypothetical protein